MRTNAELVKILRTFNGANDISVNNPGIHTFDAEANWTLAALQLFKKSRNYILGERFISLKGYLLLEELNTLHSLNITKSLVQISISHEAVDFVFDELNVDRFIKQLESKSFGVDELFWATLNTDDVVNLPGGFTKKFLTKDNQTYMTTRFTVWLRDKNPPIPCRSAYFRRWICVFGSEDLPDLVNVHHLYVNKLLSSFDFAAVQCLLEHVYNRTYFPTEDYLFDLEKYSQLPHVSFRKVISVNSVFQVRFHNDKVNNLDSNLKNIKLPKISYW